MRREVETSSTTPSMADATKFHSNSFNGRTINFNLNMLIVLAALLSALTCALSFNFILRCIFRYRWIIISETSDEATARRNATGLDKRELRRIPVAVYGPELNIPANECPICLGEFGEGEKVRVLPTCHHGFHVRCIDTWLSTHSSCPICRQSLCDGSRAGGGGGRQVETVVVMVER